MYALVSHLEKEYGVHYAMGGVQAIADAMANVIRAQGGTIRLETEADEILLDKGRAAGVRLASGETLAAPLVVSNADAGPHLHPASCATIHAKRWTDPARLKNPPLVHGPVRLVFRHRGTAAKWRDVGHHTILSGPRYEGLLNDIFIKGRLADDMSLYLHRPLGHRPWRGARRGTIPSTPSPPCRIWAGTIAVDWETSARSTAGRSPPLFLERTIPGFEQHLSASHILTPADFETPLSLPQRLGVLHRAAHPCNPPGSAPITSARRPRASISQARAPHPGAGSAPVSSPPPRCSPA